MHVVVDSDQEKEEGSFLSGRKAPGMRDPISAFIVIVAFFLSRVYSKYNNWVLPFQQILNVCETKLQMCLLLR